MAVDADAGFAINSSHATEECSAVTSAGARVLTSPSCLPLLPERKKLDTMKPGDIKAEVSSLQKAIETQ